MRVLIVEDSEPLRESLRIGLAREGFAVDVAPDGESGLSYARNNPYDVIVPGSRCCCLAALLC